MRPLHEARRKNFLRNHRPLEPSGNEMAVHGQNDVIDSKGVAHVNRFHQATFEFHTLKNPGRCCHHAQGRLASHHLQIERF